MFIIDLQLPECRHLNSRADAGCCTIIDDHRVGDRLSLVPGTKFIVDSEDLLGRSELLNNLHMMVAKAHDDSRSRLKTNEHKPHSAL